MAVETVNWPSSSIEITSDWPLPDAGRRFVTPQFLLDFLATHPVSKELYPLAVGFYPEALGHNMTREVHDSHLMLYCTSGEGTVETDSQHLSIHGGDAVILPRGVPHRYHSSSNHPWSLYWVHYDGELSAEYTGLIGSEVGSLALGLQPKLIADFEALFSLQRAGFSELQFLHGACQLKQLLTAVAADTSRYQVQGGQRIDLDQIHELMHLRIDGQLDLSELAANAKLSRFHFARRFKQLTGHSPIQHFIHLKMEFACHLLDSTGDSVKQVATALGYADPYYFSRLFKQTIGRSPTEYRQVTLV